MLTVTGDLGLLFVGYRIAAKITNWQITKKAEVLSDTRIWVVGNVEVVNTFYITQKLTSIELFMGGSIWWVWENPYVGTDSTILIYGDPKITKR